MHRIPNDANRRHSVGSPGRSRRHCLPGLILLILLVNGGYRFLSGPPTYDISGWSHLHNSGAEVVIVPPFELRRVGGRTKGKEFLFRQDWPYGQIELIYGILFSIGVLEASVPMGVALNLHSLQISGETSFLSFSLLCRSVFLNLCLLCSYR